MTGPLVPLYAAYSPEILLLARCFWRVEDAVRARHLIAPDEIPSLGGVCFQLLASPERPVPDEPTITEPVELKRWLVQEDCRLTHLVDHLVCIDESLADTVSLAELVRAIRWKHTDTPEYYDVLERYPALARWRDVVLKHPKPSRLARAAALEIEALCADMAGREDAGDELRAKARQTIVRRKRSA